MFIAVLMAAAFLLVRENPEIAWIMAGIAFFILFFFRSRETILLYAVYFAFEETILLHSPESFIILIRYMGDIMILALFFATFAKLALRRYDTEFFRENKLHLFIFLFLGSAILSAILNSVPVYIAFVSIRQLLRYLVVFYAIVLTAQSEWTQDDLRNLAKIVISLILIQAAIGYLQILLGPESDLTRFFTVGKKIEFEGAIITGSVPEELRRSPLGTLLNPNAYGLFLTAGFCLLLGIYLCPGGEKRNLNLFLLLAFLSFPLLKSLSRQSIYATLLGATAIGILKKELKILFFTIIIVGGFSYYLFEIRGEAMTVTPRQMTLGQRIVSPFHPQYRKLYQYSDRFYAVTEFAPQFLKSRYAYFGLGPGAVGSPFGYFQGYFEGYKKMGVPMQMIEMIHTGVADVGFLAIVGQYGIVGFVIFYSILIVLFRYVQARVLPYMEDRFYQGVTLGFTGYIVALFVANIGYSNLAIRQISFYFWVMAALVCSFKRASSMVSLQERGSVPSDTQALLRDDRGHRPL